MMVVLNLETVMILIRIAVENMPKALAAAYNLSNPQGMGYLHFVPGDASPETAGTMFSPELNAMKPIRLDYLTGRAVKLAFQVDEIGYYVEDTSSWFDHSEQAWAEFKNVILEG